MKAASFILKIAALILAAAAIVCCVLANLEAITDTLLSIKNRFQEKRAHCQYDGIDEFEDWDI